MRPGKIGSFLSEAVSTSILRGPLGHKTATKSENKPNGTRLLQKNKKKKKKNKKKNKKKKTKTKTNKKHSENADTSTSDL